jgi:pimeloyl-ACP methyl ester carboxylesterase
LELTVPDLPAATGRGQVRTIRPRPADPGAGWVDLDGPTYYVDHGGPSDGPLLVCVHGLGGSLLNWAAIAPLLTQTCRVLAIDLPGHGRTRALGRPTTVNADQRLLHRFLTEICDGPAVVVGNSMGGMISILQAAAHPETVTGLVLIDPALPQIRFTKPDPRVAAGFLAFAVPGIGRAVLAGRRHHNSPERAVDAMLRLCCADPSRIPGDLVQAAVELTRERLTYPGTDSEFLSAARSLMWVLTNHRAYESRMSQVRAPVLLLHGDKDRLVSLTSARVVARANPTWRFEVALNVGHVPQLEVPHWTADTILDWLTTAGSVAADGVVLN